MTVLQLQDKIICIEKKLDKLLELLSKQSKSSCSYTLHSWLDEWLVTYKKPFVKQNSLNVTEVAIRVHIKPNLPDMPLSSVNGLMLQKFLLTIEKSRTRKSVFTTLNMAFNLAYELKLIDENPMHGVKIAAHVEKKGQNLSHEEQRAFLSAITGHPAENYFKLLLYTGCRRNEILSLNIKDIDYKNKTLHINGTKTNSSNRTIPLFDEAAALLSVLPHNSDGFFFNFRPDYVTHAFKKICPEHKLHDLRHTFATNCLEAEIPLKVVQKWLGHSNIDTTADIYTHVTQDISCAEAHKLTALYNQKNSR